MHWQVVTMALQIYSGQDPNGFFAPYLGWIADLPGGGQNPLGCHHKQHIFQSFRHYLQQLIILSLGAVLHRKALLNGT